jgi:hypothetical protein
MKRWHEEFRITRREWRRHRSRHAAQNRRCSQGFGPGQRCPGSDPDQVDCSCDNQPGRFRKKDAHDCGLARCPLCHGYKFPRRQESYKDHLADLACKEQVHEWQQEQELETRSTDLVFADRRNP